MDNQFTLPIEYELDFERVKKGLETAKSPQGWNVKKGGSCGSDILLNKNRIYCASCNGKIYCLSLEGEKIWSFETDGVILNTLTIKDDVIYLGSFDGNFYALDLDGRVKWSYSTGDKLGYAPLVYKERIFFGNKGGRFHCLNLEGKLLWNYDTTSLATSPSVYNDIVFFGDNAGMNAFTIDGERLWYYETGAYVGTAHFYKNNIYFSCFNRNIYCLTLEGKTVWTKEMNSFAYISRTLGIFDGKIVVGLMDHYLYCLDAETGKEIWKFNGLIPVKGTKEGDTLYVGDLDNRFIAIDFKTGKQKWMYLTNGGIFCEPLVTEDRVVFSCWDTYIYCVDKQGKTLWKFKAEGNPSTVDIEHRDEITTKYAEPLPEVTLPKLYKSLATGHLETEHVYGSSMSGYVAKEKHYVQRRRYV